MRSRILIVDDDDKIISIFAQGLAFEGYDVLTASNGAEGLKVILVRTRTLSFWMS